VRYAVVGRGLLSKREFTGAALRSHLDDSGAIVVRQLAVDLADVDSPSSVIKEARNHLPHGAADQTIHHTWSRILDRLDELCRINTLNTYATATGTM
jgi:hypothetical protein